MNFKEDVYKHLGISLTDTQLKQFEQYLHFLLEQNKIVNLTAITDVKEVYYKHFFDSLLVSKILDLTKVDDICDMGSGAGFPSIPIKIAFPHTKITIIDSLGKRTKFLEALTALLKLDHVTIINDRIETSAHRLINRFDLVIARALGSSSLVSEMGLPMTRLNGHLILLKGLNYEEDLSKAQNAMTQCGGKVEQMMTEVLPYEYGTRVIIKILKIKKVQGYPRSYAQMLKKPL